MSFCPIVGPVNCNETIQGDNTGKANNFLAYGCGFDASGPEAMYEFVSETKVFVWVRLVEDAISNDLYILPGGDCPNDKIPACNGQCGWGHWWGNGNCNSIFDCPELNFDNGDCE